MKLWKSADLVLQRWQSERVFESFRLRIEVEDLQILAIAQLLHAKQRTLYQALQLRYGRSSNSDVLALLKFDFVALRADRCC